MSWGTELWVSLNSLGHLSLGSPVFVPKASERGGAGTFFCRDVERRRKGAAVQVQLCVGGAR